MKNKQAFTLSRHAELVSASSRSIKKEEALDKNNSGATLLSGFTLIELLVVVLIIGILAAVALPQYQKAVQKSRLAEYWTVLSSLYGAAHVCELAQGHECTLAELDIQIPACKPLPGNQSCSYGIYQGAAYMRSYGSWALFKNAKGNFCASYDNECESIGFVCSNYGSATASATAGLDLSAGSAIMYGNYLCSL